MMSSRVLRNTALLLVVLLLSGGSAFAQTLAERQKRRDAIEQDIKILKNQLGKASSEHENALAAIAIIQAQIDSRKKLLNEADGIIATYNREIKALNVELGKQQALMDTLKLNYGNLVLSAYKNRDIRIWYMYLLSSKDVPQAYRRLGYFKSLSSQIKKQSEKIQALQTEINTRKSDLQALRADARKMRDQRAADLSAMRNEEKEQQALIERLEKDKKSYKAALLNKQKEQAALNKQISKMLAEAASASSSGKASKGKKSGGSKPVDIELSKNFEQNKGKLPWPVSGPVVDHFGASKKGGVLLNHDYISIACNPSTMVKSVFDGVVVNVGLLPGFGHCVMIQHGAYYTIYGKLQSVLVHHGDKVTTGQAIGEIGLFGGRSGLNFYVVHKMTYLNPEQWLRNR